MDPLGFLDIFSKVDEAITVLEKYRTKLKGDYDTAYLKLDEALDEIDKMVDAILEWLRKFIYLHPEEITQNELERSLLDFELTTMEKRIEKSRGHCHKVANIYDKYLENFFSARLNRNELGEIRNAFVTLSDMDGHLYTAMEGLCHVLPQKTSELKSMLEAKGSMQDIGKKHHKNRNEVLKVYRSVSDTMERMYKVRNWFIQIGKIT